MLTIEQARTVLSLDQGPRLTLMEVCGTHTAAIAASGLRSLLAPSIRLVSGPGCPVCVTPAGYIDQLCELAYRPDHLIACFGDLIRVPGRTESLAQAMARGGQVRMVYSPLDALALCRSFPTKTIVMAAVGFETTAPAYGLLMARARADGVTNLRLLTALRRMIPALDMLCQPAAGIDGFLAPGHVSAILGSEAYRDLAEQFGKPFVIAGFSPEQVLGGLAELVRILRSRMNQPAGAVPGSDLVSNQYPAIVRPAGNWKAQAVLADAFVTGPAVWRGLGMIADSGYRLSPAYADFAAGPASEDPGAEPPGCRCGEILLAQIEPADCPLFGTACRPDRPIGPCMVSSEGVCGIHYRFPAVRLAATAR